jgi:hypothetical protein
MKRLLLLLFLLNCATFLLAQDSLMYGIFPLVENHISYQRIVEAPGKSKDDLYKMIKSWSVSAFNSQKDALQSEDRVTGLIIYKFNFNSSFESPKIDGASTTIPTTYWQNLKFYIKDGKLKIIIDNLSLMMNESTFNVETYALDIKAFNDKAIEDVKKTMKVSEKLERQMRENASNYDRSVIRNFSEADKEIKKLLAGVETYIKSGKSEFDF